MWTFVLDVASLFLPPTIDGSKFYYDESRVSSFNEFLLFDNYDLNEAEN